MPYHVAVTNDALGEGENFLRGFLVGGGCFTELGKEFLGGAIEAESRAGIPGNGLKFRRGTHEDFAAAGEQLRDAHSETSSRFFRGNIEADLRLQVEIEAFLLAKVAVMQNVLEKRIVVQMAPAGTLEITVGKFREDGADHFFPVR